MCKYWRVKFFILCELLGILGVKRSCYNDSCIRLKCIDIFFNLYEIIKSFNVFLKENDNIRFNK